MKKCELLLLGGEVLAVSAKAPRAKARSNWPPRIRSSSIRTLNNNDEVK